MRSETYRTRAGQTRYRPVMETEDEMYAVNGSDEGFCLGCGSTRSGVEPDARKYTCESCGESLVYGFQELLFMDLLKFDLEEVGGKPSIPSPERNSAS